MNARKEPTEGYEDRLLAELRRVVEANPEPTPTQRGATTTLSYRWRRPLAVTGGLAAAAVASVAVVGFGEEGSGTAWAVTPNDDGTVTVVINSLRDAEGLEQKLREAGVPAVVQYLPDGKKCAPPPEGEPHPAEVGWGRMLSGPQSGVAYEAPWGEMVASGGDDGIEFKIKPVPDDKSLAITTQNRTGGEGDLAFEESGLRVEYFKGEESPCKVVDA